MCRSLQNKKGMTLIALLASVAAISVSALMLGKINQYLVRSRQRTESRVSLLQTKNTVINLLMRKMAKVLDERDRQGRCPSGSVLPEQGFAGDATGNNIIAISDTSQFTLGPAIISSTGQPEISVEILRIEPSSDGSSFNLTLDRNVSTAYTVTNGSRIVRQSCQFCPSGADFENRFKNQVLTFPGSSAELVLVDPTEADLVALMNRFPPQPAGTEAAQALAACQNETSVRSPASDADPTPYLFCLALRNPNPLGTDNFLDSEAAFIQARVELMSSEMEQNRKMFGPVLACNSWIGRKEQRQFKVTYRIFWKKQGDKKAVFQNMDYQFINFDELI